jgi:hypothetical protein
MVKKNKKQLKPIIDYNEILNAFRYRFNFDRIVMEIEKLNKYYGITQWSYIESSFVFQIFILDEEWSQVYEDDVKKLSPSQLFIKIVKVEKNWTKLTADNNKLTRQVKQLTKDLNWWTNHITLWSLIKKIF